jgi:hypothetical protein
MLYLPYGLSDSCLQFYLKIKMKLFFLFPTPFFFHSVPPFPYLFHPSYQFSTFVQYFFPFLSLPLSHFTTSIPLLLNCLSLLIAHYAPSFLSFYPIPVFSILVPISKSLSLAVSLPRYSGVSAVIHLSYSLLYLDSLILSPLSCLSVSLSLSLNSTFIHLSFALNLSTSFLVLFLSLLLLRVFSFLSSIPLVSDTLPFHPFCPQTLPPSFSLSPSAYFSYTLPSLCFYISFLK